MLQAGNRGQEQRQSPLLVFLGFFLVFWGDKGSMEGDKHSVKFRILATSCHHSFFFPDSEITWVSFGFFPLELPKWQLNTTDYCSQFDTVGDNVQCTRPRISDCFKNLVRGDRGFLGLPQSKAMEKHQDDSFSWKRIAVISVSSNKVI